MSILFKPIIQLTPGCMLLGTTSSPCDPGYRCEDSCDGITRYKCVGKSVILEVKFICIGKNLKISGTHCIVVSALLFRL